MTPGDNGCNWKYFKIRNIYVDFFFIITAQTLRRFRNSTPQDERIMLWKSRDFLQRRWGKNPRNMLVVAHLLNNCQKNIYICRSQWPHGLRRGSAAARLLRSWVRIPRGARMFVCCECCVLSGRGLCDELITRPEESCRLWCVVVCDLETSRMRRP